MMAGGERGGEGTGGAGMRRRRWRRRGQAGTVAGGRVGELLRVSLREPRVGAAHGHRRGSGAPGGHARRHVDALGPHHHGTLLVHVLLLLALAYLVVEVLALTLGQHLGVEGSLCEETQGGDTLTQKNQEVHRLQDYEWVVNYMQMSPNSVCSRHICRD